MMPDTPKKKSLQLIIHLLGWGIVFGIPLFFFERNSTADYIDRYLRFISAPVSLMIIFYFNYCYLIDKFLFRKQTREYLLSNIVLIAFVTYACTSGTNCIFREQCLQILLNTFR